MSNAGFGTKIQDIGVYLPGEVLTNKFLCEKFGFDINFLQEKIGIRERRVASKSETASFMAIKAGQELIRKTNINREDVDFLLLCTQNPDYRLPTTACLVQNELGLKKSCFCFDINLGCSGFVYGLKIASNFVQLGQAKMVLVIMVDQYTKFLNPDDRNTVAIFGDGAAATLLFPCEIGFGVLDGIFGTDGSGAKHLIFENSAVVTDSTRPNHIFMNGREIFKFALKVVPESINELLKIHSLKISDIRFFVFHQANRFMLEEIKKRLDISAEQMVIEMESYGNTVSASIPIALERKLSTKELKRGDYLVFAGFGVGLSWGSVLYRVP